MSEWKWAVYLLLSQEEIELQTQKIHDKEHCKQSCKVETHKERRVYIRSNPSLLLYLYSKTFLTN